MRLKNIGNITSKERCNPKAQFLPVFRKKSSFYYNLPNLLAIEWTSKGFLEHDKRSIEKRIEGRLCIQVIF